jgi:hypothetical protein
MDWEIRAYHYYFAGLDNIEHLTLISKMAIILESTGYEAQASTKALIIFLKEVMDKCELIYLGTAEEDVEKLIRIYYHNLKCLRSILKAPLSEYTLASIDELQNYLLYLRAQGIGTWRSIANTSQLPEI